VKTGFRVFIAAFVALGASWCGFVLAPVLQLGTAKQETVLNSSDTYPLQRTGDATLGLQVYRASGCAACHTEQIQQSGVACEIELTSVGKNPDAVEKQINAVFAPSPFFGVNFITNDQNIPYGGPPSIDISHLPQIILNHLEKSKADAVVGGITSAGGKAEIHIVATGADISRGWGIRRSVAADYLYDNPVQLGSLRVGPDLADVGARLGNANWQLLHLYAPHSVTKNSAMPPFRFLFETKKIGDAPSPDALQLPKELVPPVGYEVIPTDDAKNLVAYLLSLRADVPLYEAPFTPPQVSTNTPANKK
jgi:cbb3-type cytochrome oxidase cytochrome c subunit